MPSSSRIKWVCYKKWKVERAAQTGNVSTVDIHLLLKTPVSVLPWICRCEGKWRSRVIGGKSNPHKWLTSRKSEVLRSLRHYLRAQIQGHHTSVVRKREAWKRGALDDLPWKDERGPSSVRRTLEPFQRRRWGNSWETGSSAYGLFRAHKYHLELNWHWTTS